MINKLIHIANYFERKGNYRVADQIDKVMIKIAATQNLNQWSEIVSQAGGQLPQIVDYLRIPSSSTSFVGTSTNIPIPLPDYRANVEYQMALRTLNDPSATDQEKQSAAQKMAAIYSKLQSMPLSAWSSRPELRNRALQIIGKTLMQYFNRGQYILPNQMQFFNGTTPPIYGMAPSVAYPWITQPIVPYTTGEPAMQYIPFK